MPKIDPLGAVKSPLTTKLSADIAKPAEQEPEPRRGTASSLPASAGTAPSQNGATDRREGATTAAQKLDRFTHKQVRLTHAEMETCEQSLRVLWQVFGVQIQYSELARALFSLVHLAEDDIVELGRSEPKLVRPSSHDMAAKAEIEDKVAAFLLRAFKRTAS